MNWKKLLFILAVVFLLFGCARVSNSASSNAYGFWSGLWHGLIVIFNWIGSWFSDDIIIYSCNNTGGWYDFGFLLGIGALSSSSIKIR